MHKIDGMTSIGVIITQKCKLDTNQVINNGIVNISSNKPTDETGYGIWLPLALPYGLFNLELNDTKV